VPEIVELLTTAGAKDLALRFVPVSAPLSRGIFATSFAHVDAGTSDAMLYELYRETFRNEPFARVPAKRLPEVAAVSGTNHAEIGIQPGPPDAAGKRVVACFSVTDNLIKGGAGQAIQSMNLMLGLDERLTLEDPGGWP
jgi:N-acetyl-gamma-glutamyl-phosphate reductase